ncbi:MAG: hypothetical protein PHH30_08210 [Bacteroidales bacterium]|jgi:hypothetical protein|nr:hypothetical protein [Endomicrobiaceae bacterium]MDD3741210.1 hypothetical protein [Bacteroidales bacterium]
MIKKITVLSLLITVAAFARLDGAFESMYWGVRPLAMGGAFTAVANDVNAPLYNVAGIANLSQRQISLTASRLFTGLEGVEIGTNYFGYTQPLSMKTAKYGVMSFAWASLSSPGLSREDTFNIGYARYLNDIFNLDTNIVNLTAGLNLKYLRHEYNFNQSNSPGLYPSSKGGVTADIGLLAQFANGISVGYSNKYLTSPDIGFVYEDKVENINVIGLAYYNDLLPSLRIPYFTAALDVMFRNNETVLRVGLESYIIDGKLAIRTGGREEAFDIGFGYEFLFSNNKKLIIDYALEIPLQVEESYGSHFFGISFNF